MKKGWEIKKLSELFTIKPPKKLAKEKLNYEDEISFVPMACLNIENRNLSLKQSKQLKDAYKGYTYFADNDVLLAKITPCFENGKVGIAKGLLNGIGFGSSEFIVFRPNGHIVPEYLYYYLSQESFRDEGKNRMAGAVGHKRVSKEFIKEYLLPFPESKEEQKRIVAILDKAFTAIDKAKSNTEKNLANAKELFESYLNGIFENPGKDWEEERLGEVVRIKTGKLNANAMVEEGQYPFFTCSREIFAIDKYAFDCEAILLAGNNASGDFNVKHYKGKFNAYQRTYVITIDNKNKLLYPYLNQCLIRNLAAFKEQSVGTNTKFLKLGMIQGMNIPLPPISKQKLILSKLNNLSSETKHLEKIYQKKIANLEELKKSILQKVFEGKL